MNVRKTLEKKITKNLGKRITKKDIHSDNSIARGIDRFPEADEGPVGWKKTRVRSA